MGKKKKEIVLVKERVKNLRNKTVLLKNIA